MTNEVQTRSESLPATQEQSQVALMLGDPEFLKEFPADKVAVLWNVVKEERALLAREAFHKAFHTVQVSMLPVRKAGYNEHNKSRWAKLEDIENMLTPLLLGNGFAISTSNTESGGQCQLLIRHVGGHDERHFIDAPVDDKGLRGSSNKTAIQGIGSTMTYCKRYLLTKVFNIEVTDKDDDDGVGSRAERITESEAADLNSLADEVGADVSSFKHLFGVDRLEDLPKSSMKAAVWALRQKAKDAT